MKKYISEFLKNKYNMALLIVQIIALILFGFGNVWSFCFILAIIAEGIFFIVLGIKSLFDNKKMKHNQEVLSNLPMEESDLSKLNKRNNIKIKANKFQSTIFIFLGLLLIFIALF